MCRVNNIKNTMTKCSVICVLISVMLLFTGCDGAQIVDIPDYSGMGFENRYGFDTFVEVLDCDFEDNSVSCYFNVLQFSDDTVEIFEDVSIEQLKSQDFGSYPQYSEKYYLENNNRIKVTADNLSWIIMDRIIDEKSGCVALKTAGGPPTGTTDEYMIIMPLEMLDLNKNLSIDDHGADFYSCDIKIVPNNTSENTYKNTDGNNSIWNRQDYSNLGFENRCGFDTFIIVEDYDFDAGTVKCRKGVFQVTDYNIKVYRNREVEISELYTGDFGYSSWGDESIEIKHNDYAKWEYDIGWEITDRIIDKGNRWVILETVNPPGYAPEGFDTLVIPVDMLDLDTVSNERSSSFECRLKK